jgi:hypothetical protein
VRSLRYLTTVFLLVFVMVLSALAFAQSQTQSAAPTIVARVAGKLNSKSAKPGDPVSAAVLRSVKLRSGVEIPKGSTLEGLVVTVHSKQDGNGVSMLAIKFDRLQPKVGAVIPIQGVIVAIGKPTEQGTSGEYNEVAGTLSKQQDPFHYKDESEIPAGSTLSGVTLSSGLDADAATELRGYGHDIKLDQSVLIHVTLP